MRSSASGVTRHSRIRMPREGAGAETRRIEQHRTDRPDRRPARVRHDRVLSTTAGAPEIVREALHPVPAHVPRDHQSSFAPERQRLPAGRRSGVVDRRAGGQVGIPGEQRLRRVLHQERAIGIPRQLLRATPVRHQPGSVRRRLDRDAGRSPKSLQVGGASPRGLEDEARPPIVPLQEAAGLFRTEAPEPSLHQPERMGVTPGERFRIQETRSSIGRRCHGLGLRPEAPQHRVHEPAGPRPAFLLASDTLVSTAACAGTRSRTTSW